MNSTEHQDYLAQTLVASARSALLIVRSPYYHILKSAPFSHAFETGPLAQRDPEVTPRTKPPLKSSAFFVSFCISSFSLLVPISGFLMSDGECDFFCFFRCC
ncbi:hypothetical protein PGIGA_G00243030 [Pangasianodon gigas]|uniref:Uncharacterized protein n=1 Tax=Pangasianodon gigas TaxID=30993 RepID=A0ACC5WNR9_PANGG|nr:hypothetical protein [Pangasianodon gigas]